jgi:branched-chain amino acid aminotransferase
MKIWVNDSLVESSPEFIGSDGWPVGVGVFETIRTENSRPQLLSRHMRRVLLSARELSIPVPSEDHIIDAVELLLVAQPHAVGRLRLAFSKDRFAATHEGYDDAQSTIMVGRHHIDQQSSSRKHKAFPYSDNLELLALAKSNGFDEFVLIDSLGRVTEGAVTNFTFRIRGEWITPPITSGILPGVIRALAISECAVSVREISEQDLDECDAAFAMSSLKIASPVQSLDDKVLVIDSDIERICLKLRELARTL